jgi:AcrR family transcriptional regulator
MTNLTKRAMAQALTGLLAKRTLDHITVQDVANAAEISRKTFYYHFHDIFDLVEWMLLEDSKPLLTNRERSDLWIRELASALSYAEENGRWVFNLYQSLQRDQLERMLRKLIAPLVEENFDRATGGRRVNPSDRSFVLTFYTNGITSLFLNWVTDGMRSDADFLQPRLIYFFRDSLQEMAKRCVEDMNFPSRNPH